MRFLALLVCLPTQGSTARLGVWRSGQALGGATLGDAAYLLPDSADSAAARDEGAAQLTGLRASGPADDALRACACDVFDELLKRCGDRTT